MTSTDNYQQSVLTEGRKEWREQQQSKSSQDNLLAKETVLQPNYQSFPEGLLKVESQQDRQQGNLGNCFVGNLFMNGCMDG